MRFKRHLALEHGLKQIEITPLINMFFLLLIFFLFTSSFVMQSGIKVTLPKAATSEIVPYESIEIFISGENVIHLNGKRATVEELRRFLHQISKKNQSILIKADKRVAMGRVVEVWGICKDLGITQINIATN